MDILDLPKYKQVEFIPLEQAVWQVNDLEVDEAEIHYSGKVSPVSKARSGPLHFGGAMSMVIRGVTDHVGRYALTHYGAGVTGSLGYHEYFTAASPPATVKPTFVEKAPVISAALSDIDRLKYFNAAVGHGPAGVITKAYANHAKHVAAHADSKTWTWPDGNVQAAIYSHNRASYDAAELMRNGMLAQVDARQDLLLDVDFIERHSIRGGVTYFAGLIGMVALSWDQDALQKAITAGAVTVNVFGQVAIN